MEYENKDLQYYSLCRNELIDLYQPTNVGKVLEIGASTGATLLRIKELNLATEIHGFDLMNIDGIDYSAFDSFNFGNIEENLPYENNQFQLIILADLLEHLFDPKILIEKLHNLLVNDGKLIISMPNIRNYDAFIKIYLKGSFEYEESGIFDFTHLKFYCKKDIVKLFPKEKWDIEIITNDVKARTFKRKINLVDKLTFGLFQDFFATQYYLRIKKVG